MALVEFKLAFGIITGIWKHMDVWLNREISFANFYCGLWLPLLWLDSLIVTGSITEKILRLG